MRQSVRAIRIHFHHHACLFGSSNNNILLRQGADAEWTTITRTPLGTIGSIVNRFGLVQRLLRGGVHVVVSTDPLVWVAERAIWRFDGNSVHPLWIIPRGHRPLNRGITLLGDQIFIGEYFGNADQDAVRVYRIGLDGEVDVAYEFPSGRVRHVHAVEYDPVWRRLWIATGDEDRECTIGLLDPDSGEYEALGGGSQDWRTISFDFRPDAVYWGTDNHLGKNRIWRLDRQSRALEPVGDVRGPVYYCTPVGDRTVFGTTVEKGEGEQDRFARLYLRDERGVREIFKLAKDRWSAKYFGYGMWEFPRGENPKDEFWATAKGLVGGLASYRIRIEEDDG